MGTKFIKAVASNPAITGKVMKKALSVGAAAAIAVTAGLEVASKAQMVHKIISK